ncbi:methyltransferase domain-containing protein [Sphingomonas bacterium]|uniref:class I SAM-dependent methyltransferase n=1 Tax=Sphingomonas bacterium TaxID=1895847 RepID=UPI0026051D91|nr:methyltransferase domain-containing protein [Sphingomonas bacterium]MDB5678272.1 methyltransferase [Sphingomonas bacterium]
MRRLLAVALLATTAACSGNAPTANTAAPDTSLARDTATDARRHGPEIAAFAGLKAGDKVIDLIPGGGYWTRTFARIVGPSGHVYGIWAAPYANEAATDVRNYAALTRDPGFANVSASTQAATELKAAEPVDLVFTSQNYHDYPDKFMGNIDPAVLNTLAFDALKPGGIFLIIDHAAAAGSGMRDTDTLHRIDPAIVKKQVEAAGFAFVGESKLLANPGDDRTKAVFDKSIRGRTDQFIFKFKKP